MNTDNTDPTDKHGFISAEPLNPCHQCATITPYSAIKDVCPTGKNEKHYQFSQFGLTRNLFSLKLHYTQLPELSYLAGGQKFDVISPVTFIAGSENSLVNSNHFTGIL